MELKKIFYTEKFYEGDRPVSYIELLAYPLPAKNGYILSVANDWEHEFVELAVSKENLFNFYRTLKEHFGE